MAKKGASKKKAVKPAVKPAKTPAAGPPKLEKQVLTELLRDIEAKGVPYKEIVLADLCNAKQGIYGFPGRNTLRRSVQKKFDELKRLKVAGYRTLLKEAEVEPGRYSYARFKEEDERLAREAAAEPKGKKDKKDEEKKEQESEDEIEEIEDEEDATEETSVNTDDLPIEDDDELSSNEELPIEDEEEPIDEDSAEILADLTRSFQQATIGAIKSNKKANMTTENPTRTSQSSSSFSSVASPSTKNNWKTAALPPIMHSPAGAKFASAPLASENCKSWPTIQPPGNDVVYRCLDFFQQDGTREFPRIVLVSPFPERNGPFSICRLEKMEVGNFTYNAFNVSSMIRKMFSLLLATNKDPKIHLSQEIPDFKSHELFVPDPREWQNLVPLLGRVLVCAGPSLPFSQQHWKLFHRQGKVNCPTTQRAHEKLDAEIKADPSRKTGYSVLVFPEGTCLDNSILSTNNFDVVRYANGMKVDPEDPDVVNEFGRKINLMNTWWQIAEAGGERIRADPVKQKVDASALLD